MKILRDYQNEGISAVNAALMRGLKRMIACFATGLGKTLTAVRILQPYKRSLWLTHREELILQSARVIMAEEEDLRPLTPNFIGIVKAEKFEIDRKVVVASVQTLHNRLDKIDPKHFDCIIVDECHLSASKSFKKILDHFQPRLVLGLTATPHRLDGLPLGDIFEEIVIEKDIAYGIGQGYLVEIDGILVKTSTDLNAVHTVGGDLNAGELEKTINTLYRNNKIAEAWLEYTPNQVTIGFCTSVQHAIDLCDVFRGKGIPADFVCADKQLCPDRKERLAKFKAKETLVMFNVDILTVGYDFPEVSCTIATRPTKSLTMYMQGPVGRGTRPAIPLHHLETVEERIKAIQESAKPKLTILDIVDVTSRHALINTWTLDKDKKLKDKLFKTREFKEAEFARVSKIEKEIEKTEKRKLLELPKIVVNRTANTLRDATEKQLAWLKSIGYDTENNVYTVADCMEIIGALPATDAQIWRLKKEGYNIEAGATRAQADAVITEVNMKKQADLEAGKLKNLPFAGIN